MWVILNYFWKICLFRTSPEKIPPSTILTAALLSIYTASAFIYLLSNEPASSVFSLLGKVIVGLLVEASIVYALLYFKRFQTRFLSTFCALLGCNIILFIILLPQNLLILNLAEGFIVEFVALLSLFCLIWWLTIAGFILQKSADISIIQGTMLAFIFELLGELSTSWLFPDI